MSKELDDLLAAAPRWATMRPDGWLDGLRELCDLYVRPDDVLVELGSYAGESTVTFAEYAKRVYAVDPWSVTYMEQIFEGCGAVDAVSQFEASDFPTMQEVERIFDARVARFRNVEKIKGSADEAHVRFANGSLDLVYIDSIHTYEVVSRSIVLWEPKLRTGGVIAGHDYNESGWPGVVRAVTEAFGEPDRVFSDSSWVVRLSPRRRRSLR